MHPAADPVPATDPGSVVLKRIGWFQAVLLGVGAAAWRYRSPRAALAFALAGAASMLFWQFHCWIVTRMLTPTRRGSWTVGILALLKLALLAVLLRAIMECFPSEVIPSVTGILLFSAAILLEAARLVFRAGSD